MQTNPEPRDQQPKALMLAQKHLDIRMQGISVQGIEPFLPAPKLPEKLSGRHKKKVALKPSYPPHVGSWSPVLRYR